VTALPSLSDSCDPSYSRISLHPGGTKLDQKLLAQHGHQAHLQPTQMPERFCALRPWELEAGHLQTPALLRCRRRAHPAEHRGIAVMERALLRTSLPHGIATAS